MSNTKPNEQISDSELFEKLSSLKDEIPDEPAEEVASPESVEETVTPDDPTIPDYEAEARERGWKPKEQFIGDPNIWVDAEEFVKREPLYKALHKVSRELRRQQDANEALKKFYQGQLKKEQNQLEQRRDDALARDDAQGAVEAERQLNAVTAQAGTLTPQTDLKRVFETWVADNDWYRSKSDMKEYADAIGMKIMAERNLAVGTMTETEAEDVFTEITTRVKKIFKSDAPVVPPTPEKPKVLPKRSGAASAESAPKVPSYKQLPEEARGIYRQLVKSDKNPRGIMTHEEYMRDYVQAGGPLINGE